LRRFTFKIARAFLGADQIRAAYRRFFGVEAPTWTTTLDRLTPADFALVAKRARVLGADGDAEALGRMLQGEQEAKPDYGRPVGFLADKEWTRERS